MRTATRERTNPERTVALRAYHARWREVTDGVPGWADAWPGDPGRRAWQQETVGKDSATEMTLGELRFLLDRLKDVLAGQSAVSKEYWSASDRQIAYIEALAAEVEWQEENGLRRWICARVLTSPIRQALVERGGLPALSRREATAVIAGLQNLARSQRGEPQRH